MPNPPDDSQTNPERCGSISRVIREMKQGDDTGFPLIWDRFYTRLTALVRTRLRDQLRTVADEEDVALDSLLELFRGLLDGKYPVLNNRESLWYLLVRISACNVVDQLKTEQRQKRGSGRVINESAFETSGETSLFDHLESQVDEPDVQLMITERCAELLESLQDPQHQAIAIMKTSGTSNKEIAQLLGTSLRSVERRLEEIRKIWSHHERDTT